MNLLLQAIEREFGGSWSSFVSYFLKDRLEEAFKSQGMEITSSYGRSESKWKNPDNNKVQIGVFDSIFIGKTKLTVVKAERTLRPKDVDRFLEDLKNFHNYFPMFKTKDIYGAMAYIESEDMAPALAVEKGLFVAHLTGCALGILNDQNFKPKDFS